jgi:hypothetical protein
MMIGTATIANQMMPVPSVGAAGYGACGMYL